MTTTTKSIDVDAWREAERIVERADRDDRAAKYEPNARWQSVAADVLGQPTPKPTRRTVAEVYAEVRRAKVDGAKQRAAALTEIDALDAAVVRATHELAKARAASRTSSLEHEEARAALAVAGPLDRTDIRAAVETRRVKRDADVARMRAAQDALQAAQGALYEAHVAMRDPGHLSYIGAERCA